MMNRTHRAAVANALAALAVLGCAPARSARTEASATLASAAPEAARTDTARPRRVVLYASERDQLHALALDSQTGELAEIASVVLPAQVHYASADREARFLYVSTSDGASQHGLHAFAIDPETGALAEHGPSLAPPLGRIIHFSVDPARSHLVLAHNRAAQLSSVRLDEGGRLAGFVEQATPAETGFFAHQALLDATGGWVVACGLGADASGSAPEEPGSLTLFRHEQGQLTRVQTVLPGPGLGPRHLDYAGERVFVVMERGNRLSSYRLAAGQLAQQPEQDLPTLRSPESARPGQRAGAIHLHPSGKFLYVTNRANRTTTVRVAGEDAEVFAGGENNVALFALEPGSGEPGAVELRPVEHHDTRGFEPRTFTIEPSGRFLIVANQSERKVLDGPSLAAPNLDAPNLDAPNLDAEGSLRTVPRSLVVFEIADDGRLSHRHTHEFTRGDLFWVGSIELPG